MSVFSRFSFTILFHEKGSGATSGLPSKEVEELKRKLKKVGAKLFILFSKYFTIYCFFNLLARSTLRGRLA
jgi:hypothetical protein